MLHCGGERSISYEVAKLLVDLLDLCSGRVAYPIDEPESVEAKTTIDKVFGRDGWELPTLHGVDDDRAASLERLGQLSHGGSTHRIEDETKRLDSCELRERNDVLPHGRVGRGLTDPVAGHQGNVSVEQEIGGNRVNPYHRELQGICFVTHRHDVAH